MKLAGDGDGMMTGAGAVRARREPTMTDCMQVWSRGRGR
jgi:hypothetical protein